MTHRWQSVLIRNGYTVATTFWGQYNDALCADFDAWLQRAGLRGRLVIIELKTSPDREMAFQAADYWRKIELQRRRGILAKARLFGDIEIVDKPALVYLVSPALSIHRDVARFSRMLCPDIELWMFELHEEWRREIKVIARTSSDSNSY